MTKKSLIIFIFTFILICISFIAFRITKYRLNTYYNEKIIVEINDIQIEPTQNYDMYFSEFHQSDELDELKKKIDKSPDEYMFISLYYIINNLSEDKDIQEMKFYIKPDKNMRNMIKTFNPSDSIYCITSDAMSQAGMRQYIVIKKNGKSENEILNMIYEQKVQMVYSVARADVFNDWLSVDNCKYNFKVKDAVENYNKLGME